MAEMMYNNYKEQIRRARERIERGSPKAPSPCRCSSHSPAPTRSLTKRSPKKERSPLKEASRFSPEKGNVEEREGR